MDYVRFSRIKKAFERNGGKMESSPELDKYLASRGAGAVTFNEKLIIFRQTPPPTATEIFEELIHTTQYRAGRVSTESAVLLEIEAKEKLRKNQMQYGIPDNEHLQTLQQIAELKNILKGRR